MTLGFPSFGGSSSGGGGSGTVTDVSVATANGFAGSVASSTTTPAITLSTTVTGILKGNGTAISAATAGTDYLANITVGTTVFTGGTVGSMLFVGAASVVQQDNAKVFWDDTNNFFGLGNNVPVSEFHMATSSTADPRGFIGEQNSDDVLGARLMLRKSRGTFGTPTTVVTGDTVGRIRFAGYDGANFLQMASINAISTGTIAATRVPTVLTFSTATDAAPSVLTEAMRINESQNIGIGTTAPTHPLTFSSTKLTGISFNNQADQTTNFERAAMGWASNIYTIQTNQGGSGTIRQLRLQASSGGLSVRQTFTRASTDAIVFDSDAAGGTAGQWARFSPLLGASSGNQSAVTISPTWTQTSTASYSCLTINPTESTTGSGAHLLVDLQLAAASKFKVTSAGAITSVSTLSLGAAAGTTGSINLLGTTSGTVTITPAAAAGTWSLTLPTTAGNANEILTTDGAGVTSWGSIANTKIASLGITIDGGGAALTTGVKGYIEIPYACTINRVTMLADQSGSVVVDIWKDTYANYPPVVADTITASAKPTITTATKSQDSTLTGWTTSVAAGDILAFNVDSATTITRLNLILKVTKT